MPTRFVALKSTKSLVSLRSQEQPLFGTLATVLNRQIRPQQLLRSYGQLDLFPGGSGKTSHIEAAKAAGATSLRQIAAKLNKQGIHTISNGQSPAAQGRTTGSLAVAVTQKAKAKAKKSRSQAV